MVFAGIPNKSWYSQTTTTTNIIIIIIEHILHVDLSGHLQSAIDDLLNFNFWIGADIEEFAALLI